MRNVPFDDTDLQSELFQNPEESFPSCSSLSLSLKIQSQSQSKRCLPLLRVIGRHHAQSPALQPPSGSQDTLIRRTMRGSGGWDPKLWKAATIFTDEFRKDLQDTGQIVPEGSFARDLKLCLSILSDYTEPVARNMARDYFSFREQRGLFMSFPDFYKHRESLAHYVLHPRVRR